MINVAVYKQVASDNRETEVPEPEDRKDEEARIAHQWGRDQVVKGFDSTVQTLASVCTGVSSVIPR